MADSGFVPLHEAHAIEQVIAHVAFSKEATDAEFNQTKWQQFAATVFDTLPAFAPEPGVRIEQIAGIQPRMRTGIMAYTFNRMHPDGTPALQLRVERDSVAFLTTSYSRWASFFQQSLDMLQPLTHERVRNGARVSAVSLNYIDRFVWRGDDSTMDIEGLVRQDCPWVAPSIFRTRQDWHSHCGEFQMISESTRRLLNVNLDVSRIENVPSKLGRTVSIAVALTDALNQAGYKPTQHAAEEVGPWIQKTLSALHGYNKLVMTQILTDAMQVRIGLKAGEHVTA